MHSTGWGTERFLSTRAVDPVQLAEDGTLYRISTVDEVALVIEFFAGPLGTIVSGQLTLIDGGGQAWPQVRLSRALRSRRRRG